MSDRRRGMTALELLVVLSVIAVILSLVAPAVMSIRESSRRVQCLDRLKAFGIALHSFESAHKRLPPAVSETDVQGVSRLWFSPHVRILPHIEQQPLHDAIKQAADDGATARPGGLSPNPNLKVAAFLCPSDPQTQGTNYRVCTGLDPWYQGGIAYTDPPKALSEGPFSDTVGQSMAGFRDGLSQTVAASERRISNGDRSRFSRARDFWYTGIYRIIWRIPDPDMMLTLCDATDDWPPTWYPYAGQSWVRGNYNHTWYNHIAAPNSSGPDCSVDYASNIPQSPPSDIWNNGTLAGSFKASSYHPGGVSVLYMDGSVRFTNDQVDLRVWRAAATRSSSDAVESSGVF